MKPKIIFVLWTGLLFTACKIECPNCASPNYVEKDRIPVLQVGDSLMFKSNTNRIDSFLVTNVDRKEFYTDGRFSSEYYDIEYIILNYECPYKDFYKCPYYSAAIEWDRTRIWWGYFKETSMVKSPSNNMEINGIIYQTVKKLSTDSTNLKPEDVVTVYFNDQQSVLRYDLKSGEYFERIK